MRKGILTALCLTLATLPIVAQTTKEEVLADLNKAGGVYYAYPVSESKNTPAPKGYKPFYISHYGRHGSRFLISEIDYTNMADLFHEADKAGKLTLLGKDVMTRIDSVYKETKGRAGDLSPLGFRQHHAIADRMYKAYPEVFTDGAPIDARSTMVMRCAMSMDAFVESLKEHNPKLKVTREASARNLYYLCNHTKESNDWKNKEWKEEYRKFKEKHTNGERMAASLFNDSTYIVKNVNPDELIWGMYWLAVDMQDIETQLSFFDIFTPDELFDLWQCFNYDFYVCNSNYPGARGLHLDNARPLVKNIIDSADDAILLARQGEAPGATLRFGHDGNLIPLAGMMRIENCYNQESNPDDFYKAFTDFKISPMAGNIQLIFFGVPEKGKGKLINKDNPVLVKIMLNEREVSIPVATDTFPFYRWEDVKAYYNSL